jgi:heme exporter protein CcmD
MTDFITQGGYAAFVWPAYIISAIAIGAMIGLTLSAYAKAKRALARLEKKD